MLSTILIDSDYQSSVLLKSLLSNSYPNLQLKIYPSLDQPLNDADLIFINTANLQLCRNQMFLKKIKNTTRIICLGEAKKEAYQAFHLQADYFLLKPFNSEQLEKVFTELDIKPEKYFSNKTNNNQCSLIGIPTMDGLEYFHVDDIILCEGLQKLTRIITINRTNIISSYHIGKFIHLLQPMGFFSPHKSYLINLAHLKRYCKDGMVFLTNKHKVPVARRRRADFIKQIPCVTSSKFHLK